MKTATFLYLFSVFVSIQSETIHIYNYDNFGDVFHQGELDDLNVFKYKDIDNLFEEKYSGSNIGGAFQVDGDSISTLPNTTIQYQFLGYIVDVTASFYCGDTNLSLDIEYSDGGGESVDICNATGWHYNYKWIPPHHSEHSHVSIRCL